MLHRIGKKNGPFSSTHILRPDTILHHVSSFTFKTIPQGVPSTFLIIIAFCAELSMSFLLPISFVSYYLMECERRTLITFDIAEICNNPRNCIVNDKQLSSNSFIRLWNKWGWGSLTVIAMKPGVGAGAVANRCHFTFCPEPGTELQKKNSHP